MKPFKENTYFKIAPVWSSLPILLTLLILLSTGVITYNSKATKTTVRSNSTVFKRGIH